MSKYNSIIITIIICFTIYNLSNKYFESRKTINYEDIRSEISNDIKYKNINMFAREIIRRKLESYETELIKESSSLR